jgi:hypothetical protein
LVEKTEFVSQHERLSERCDRFFPRTACGKSEGDHGTESVTVRPHVADDANPLCTTHLLDRLPPHLFSW